MMTGLLLDKSSGTNSPPLVVTSAASRPARDTRTVEYPAPVRMRTSSTARASEAQPSSPGTTTSTDGVARGTSALTDTSSEPSGDGADAGKLDMFCFAPVTAFEGITAGFSSRAKLRV